MTNQETFDRRLEHEALASLLIGLDSVEQRLSLQQITTGLGHANNKFHFE